MNYEEFVILSPKKYSSKDYHNKTKKGIKICNNAKHKKFYNALMYNTERTAHECRIQKTGDIMTTTKTSKISLNTFDDKRFYVNKIKSYPHGENLYLFKKDLVNKIEKASVELLIKKDLEPDKHKNPRSGSTVDRETPSKTYPLTSNVDEPTFNDDKKLIIAAITLYNDLSAQQLGYQGLRFFTDYNICYYKK